MIPADWLSLKGAMQRVALPALAGAARMNSDANWVLPGEAEFTRVSALQKRNDMEALG